MGKHRSQNLKNTRRFATASALAVGATALVATPANAVEFTPGADLSVDVQDLQNIPGIENIPNIEQWIPSLANQAAPAAFAPASFTAAAPAAAPSQSNGQAIVDAARSKIGAPYGWGATGPNAFDCSGLTSWAYQQVGKAIPRTSQAQANGGTPVSVNNLQAGDIVAYYGGASHVGIYTGNGTIVHALNSSTPVSEHDLNYMPIHSAVRF